MFRIVLEPSAISALKHIRDRRMLRQISQRIDMLTEDPEKQGKSLIGELRGYRSIRAADQRYRIIYRIEKLKVIVYIITIGLRREGDRKDIYNLARKLIRQRLL